MSDDDAESLPSPQAVARAYYRALDTDDYELLGNLVTAGFVHHRPDMTLEGRKRFVEFMREERPQTDTTHPVDAMYRQTAGDELVVRGRLLASDDTMIVRFTDVFSFEGKKIAGIRTFTA